MKTEIVYICDYCDKKYTTNKEALECENSCKANIKEFEEVKLEFYHELGKIKKFDSLEERIMFLENKSKILAHCVLSSRNLTISTNSFRKAMLLVHESLTHKISRLKAQLIKTNLKGVSI